MIAFVKGIVDEIGETFVVVETSSGVGYKILLNKDSSLRKGLKEGDSVKLYTSQYFRENDQGLIGFSTTRERSFYELLITVSGVGPKLASTLLSFVNPEQLGQMLMSGEVDDIVKVPGIGKKMAERLVLELRDKVFGKGFVSKDNVEDHVKRDDNYADDMLFLEEALRKLGFGNSEIKAMIKRSKPMFESAKSVEDILRILLGQN